MAFLEQGWRTPHLHWYAGVASWAATTLLTLALYKPDVWISYVRAVALGAAVTSAAMIVAIGVMYGRKYHRAQQVGRRRMLPPGRVWGMGAFGLLALIDPTTEVLKRWADPDVTLDGLPLLTVLLVLLVWWLFPLFTFERDTSRATRNT